MPRWVAATAIGGTIMIALAAFWLSFTALVDVAHRSGISPRQAWAWPLIVDGIIVVATVSVVALTEHGPRATRYPWLLLMAGAAVSVTANSMHAVVAADVSVPSPLAASVSAVPPLVLLAITHLTVELTRRADRSSPHRPPLRRGPAGMTSSTIDAGSASSRPAGPSTSRRTQDRRIEAHRLRQNSGWSHRKIARHFGVHPSTVSRWLKTPRPPADLDVPATNDARPTAETSPTTGAATEPAATDTPSSMATSRSRARLGGTH